MANLSGINLITNVTKMTMEGDTRNVPREVSFIIAIIINGISCPFTVLLNVLVIMAVKRRPRLQSNTNILLACLAVTDALTGLVVQPSFIIAKSFYFLNGTHSEVLGACHAVFIRSLSVCSALQLMLVTCERLIAIKFTMYYLYIVTKRNIKVAVIAVWAFTFISEVVRFTSNAVKERMHNLLVSLVGIFCVLFIASSYIILYLETRRHVMNITAQQLPQEEVQRFAKESKALKTTVIVVSALALSFLPITLTMLLWTTSMKKIIDIEVTLILFPVLRTCVMLNSLLNPLIYCLRQKEMRKCVLRVPCQAVEPAAI